MKANIEPLRGKYYGTIISLENGASIEVWVMGNHLPSERELSRLNMTYEDAKADDCFCDSHYETEASFKIALAIVSALTPLEIE